METIHQQLCSWPANWNQRRSRKRELSLETQGIQMMNIIFVSKFNYSDCYDYDYDYDYDYYDYYY